MIYHPIDIEPVTERKGARFVNEPWLVDVSYEGMEKWSAEPEDEPDNVRICVPVDLNAEAILRRLRYFVYRYGEATEKNESEFSADVRRLVSQMEIYNQIWLTRSKHSRVDENGMIIPLSDEGVKLAKAFIVELEKIPDGCAELFPFELIDELKRDYQIEE